MSTMLLLVMVVGLLALLAVDAPGEDRSRPVEIGDLRPFTDTHLYLGEYQTGLYPGGVNEIPAAHRDAGVRIAAKIKPLDTGGHRDDKNGRILALVMGHSNCLQYFGAFQKRLEREAARLHPRFEMINAAVGGQQLPEIRRLEGPVWDKATQLLSLPGYSNKQVQVLFLHTTYHGWKNLRDAPPGPFPQTMQQMRDDLAAVLRHVQTLYPNLKMVYLTSDGLRRFTGFEPDVWREAFAIKWLITAQINGEGWAAHGKGDAGLPWMAWGPYIWDPTWDESHFTDGVHPSPKAREVFVEKYFDHLSADPTAQGWMFALDRKE